MGKFVIDTVGAIWRRRKQNEEKLLASYYKNLLKVAIENGIKTI